MSAGRLALPLLILAALRPAPAGAAPELRLLPRPASVRLDAPVEGREPASFRLSTEIVAAVPTPSAVGVVRATLDHLGTDDLKKRLRLDPRLDHGWWLRIGDVDASPAPPEGDEAYSLRVSSTGIALAASAEPGFRHGVRTLLQLLAAGDAVPACEIVDRPALAFRGLLIDMVRLKERDEVYFRLLEEIATWKMNALVLHFTDSEGCSIELKSLPEVVTAHAMSQETLKKLIARGAELGVRVIPEVESWGHAAWLTRPHPELSEAGSDSFCLSNDAVYARLDAAIAEVARLFPDPWLHIGCDESSYAQDDACKAKLAADGRGRMIAGHINRVNRIARKHGKTALAWGDIVLRYKDVLPLLDRDLVVIDWNYNPTVTADGLRRIREAGSKSLGAPALAWSRWRICPARESLDNISRYCAHAKAEQAEGVLTTVWVPQRWVPGSLGPGIAWAASQSWNPGGRDLKDVMAAYMRHRFGLEPTAERVDRFTRLFDVAQKEAGLKTAFWSSSVELSTHGLPDGRRDDATFAGSVAGLAEGFRKDLQRVTLCRDLCCGLVTTSEVGEYLARRRTTAGLVARRIGDAVPPAPDMADVVGALRRLDGEHDGVFRLLKENDGRDRYPDDPARSAVPESQNLLWWFSDPKAFGYARRLADRLEALSKNPTAEGLRDVLEDR